MVKFIQVAFLLSFAGFSTVGATTMAGAPPIANLPKAHAIEKAVVDKKYDYIIAGGGLAGCVLAERLSADGTKSVLVLEAGRPDYDNTFIRIPAGILRLFRSVYDWQFETAGEKSCNGRNIFLQRGKVLGGSSCTNVCLHHRGTAEDYNAWGVPGWTAADVLPYFKKSQKDMTGRDSTFHGKDGVWVMEDVRYQNPLSKRFLEVGVAAGLPFNDDFNSWGRPQEGVGRFQVSEKDGERCSGATAFLELAKKRKNVTVRTGVMVRRINFDGSKSAEGVTYDLMGDDTSEQFKAMLKDGGEVLMTAGAIGSPQILMCSGVGPADHLKEHAIDVICDNPAVGENLQDHPAAVVGFRCPQKGVSVTSRLRMFGGHNPFPILNWFMFKSGMLTSTGCDHGAFVKTNPSAEQPDLQIRFVAARTLNADGMNAYTQFRNSAGVEDGYSLQNVAVRPRSRGTVRLASSNTHIKPIIDAGYLSDKADLDTLRNGIKFSRELGRRPEWKEFLGEEIFPGSAIQSDDDINEYIKNSLHSANAIVGTCKMGMGSDCVVGPDLKVKGVSGVRVCDSSVIPCIPGGQTGTPTVMVAERAAAFILNAEVEVEVMQEPVRSGRAATA